MAFGDLLGTLSGTTAAITNPFDATGSVTVAVNDLIVVAYAERSTLSGTTVTDNLGNTYTAQNAGSDAGNSAGRAWFSLVTVAGTLTAIHLAATGSTDDAAIFAGCFAGAFAVSPLDANPANVTNDITTPFVGPASGTLAQADELIVAWWSTTNGDTAMAISSPFTLAVQAASGTGANTTSGALAREVVAATTTQTPSWTGAVTPASDVLGTMSFKKAAAAAFTWSPMMRDDIEAVLYRKTEMIGY